jgi:hypothetical protein
LLKSETQYTKIPAKSNFRILRPIFITVAIAAAATVWGCSGGGPRKAAPPPTPPGPSASVGAGATSITINSSTGVALGDVIFAYVGTQSASAIDVTTPTGWTLISGPLTQGGIQSYLFQRISDGTDGASYTFDFSGAVTGVGYASQITYRGVNNTTPVDGSVTTASQTSGTSLVLPAVSPAGSADLLVAFIQDYGGFSGTPAISGMTLVSSAAFDVFDQQLTASGSTGTKTCTNLNSSVSTGFLFAVTPSGGVIQPINLSGNNSLSPGDR